MKKISLLLTIVAMILGLSLSAQAATETASMTVKGTVPEAVTVSVTTLDFGTMTVKDVHYATATITVNASNGLSYKIALDKGQHLANNIRRMQHSSGSPYIYYWLYKDNTHNEQWGDKDYGDTYPDGTVSGPHTGTGSDQTYTVYGKSNYIAIGQAVGTYSDTVTVTVHY
jgi:spore coat protein U-like protein